MLFNHDLEASLLGGLLLSPELLPQLGFISPSDFHLPDHERIYSRMLRLHAEGAPIEVITLKDEAPLAYLVEIQGMVATSANVLPYAKQVRGLAVRRKLGQIAGELANRVAGEEPLADLVGWAERSILSSTATMSPTEGAVSAASLAMAAYQQAERFAEAGGAMLGRPSGLRSLDEVTDGLTDTDLVVIAARPGMGKSALASQLALQVAEEGSALLFSLEMSKEQMAIRMLAQRSGLNGNGIARGRLSPEEWQKLARASGWLSERRLWVDENGGHSIDSLCSEARRVAAKTGGLNLVVIDYCQLVKGNGSNREQEVSSVSRGAKALAKELHCPVLLLSQLNRGLEAREDKRPRLSDLRESGAIEQDADEVLFIYRGAVYDQTCDEDMAELIVAKNRDGRLGSVAVEWNGAATTFLDRRR